MKYKCEACGNDGEGEEAPECCGKAMNEVTEEAPAAEEAAPTEEPATEAPAAEEPATEEETPAEEPATEEPAPAEETPAEEPEEEKKEGTCDSCQ